MKRTILNSLAISALVITVMLPVSGSLAGAAGLRAGAGSVRVILQGNDSNALANAAQRHGGRVIRSIGLANGFAVEVPASQVASLATTTGVKHMVHDAPVRSNTRTDSDDVNPAKLQTVYPWAVMATQLWRKGEGAVGVAVVDSGVAAVRDFQNGAGSRLVASASFGSNGDSRVDRFGHGTAVAGVIGGNGAASNGKYIGIDPAVKLISLKVGDDNGVAYVSDVVAAIKWAVDHKKEFNIRVLNLSLSSTIAESYRTSLLDLAVEFAWFNGIVVVVSSGNCDPGAACGTLYPPANDPYVITVGATDDRGTKETADDALASFSVQGVSGDGFAKPDFAAPGRHIVTVLSDMSSALAVAEPQRVISPGYISLSGTSLSSGIVSGVVAEVLSAHAQYRPDQVKWLLSRTSQAVGHGGTAGTGSGYPRAQRAVEYGGPVGLANRGLVPNNYIAQAVAKSLGLNWNGVSWDGVSWDGVSWDGVSWDGVSWDGVSWDGVSWDGVSWDGVSWDGVSWDAMLRD